MMNDIDREIDRILDDVRRSMREENGKNDILFYF